MGVRTQSRPPTPARLYSRTDGRTDGRDQFTLVSRASEWNKSGITDDPEQKTTRMYNDGNLTENVALELVGTWFCRVAARFNSEALPKIEFSVPESLEVILGIKEPDFGPPFVLIRPQLLKSLTVIAVHLSLSAGHIEQLLEREPGDVKLTLRGLHSELHISGEEEEEDEDHRRILVHQASFRDFLQDSAQAGIFYAGGSHWTELSLKFSWENSTHPGELQVSGVVLKTYLILSTVLFRPSLLKVCDVVYKNSGWAKVLRNFWRWLKKKPSENRSLIYSTRLPTSKRTTRMEVSVDVRLCRQERAGGPRWPKWISETRAAELEEAEPSDNNPETTTPTPRIPPPKTRKWIKMTLKVLFGGAPKPVRTFTQQEIDHEAELMRHSRTRRRMFAQRGLECCDVETRN
ncbi:hypothetical protein B0H14DRAFT_2581191, partial [Mycena olivaceomarginata]